ncbi:sulfurtransferase TusA family protein [Vibrio astriarenae]|uniref:Sulfurtransferase TusA family protein n=1 Tax=Vibrio astriarenae TaxID=1481923 RepID=A0A7Z2T1V2_9VIBR|nr:sulfurtransferase TusA family protein [Vibrio astriarenae]QIA62775.1 sulfurtransferase TusA family protein [Vibrio astriarenae]
MADNLLDLRSERCPMALLLAKRFIKKHTSNTMIGILVQDKSSCHDIERYIKAQGFAYSIEHDEGECLISLKKDN